MRRACLPLILAVTEALSGCHASQKTINSPSGGTDVQRAENSPATPSIRPAPAPPASDPRPVIACFGDSLTAGFGTEAGESYPEDLQRALDASGYHYRVANLGISGNTTKDGLDRIDRVIALHPSLVVVEFGGNDGLRGLRIADTRANLDKIISTLKQSGTKVVLAGITLPPDYGPDYIRQFDETYSLLARKYNVPMIPFLLKGVFGVDGMMQADRTHATAAGNKVVAENVHALIQPLLKKPATRSQQ